MSPFIPTETSPQESTSRENTLSNTLETLQDISKASYEAIISNDERELFKIDCQERGVAKVEIVAQEIDSDTKELTALVELKNWRDFLHLSTLMSLKALGAVIPVTRFEKTYKINTKEELNSALIKELSIGDCILAEEYTKGNRTRHVYLLASSSPVQYQ